MNYVGRQHLSTGAAKMNVILQETGQQQTAKPAIAASSHSDLSQKTIAGLGWSLGTQVLSQGSRFLISVILARLIVPADFGLLGMVLVFTGFAGLFGDFGFGQSLIQREKIEERHRSSVFWLSLAIGFLLAGITVVAAPPTAHFYREPRLVPVMMLIAVSFPLGSLGTVQKALLSRDMKFRALGLIDVATTVISGLAAILLALRGFGVWSLVWQQILSYVGAMIGMWWVLGWRPHLTFDRGAVAELFGFSANLTGFSVVNYWFRNGDNLLIGRYFGSAPLGIYSRAYSLMLLPLSQVTWVMAGVMFPALSKLQNDKMRVKNIYIRMVSIIGLITFPMMLGLLVVSDHFVLALYGPAWAEMIPVLRIFCILGMAQGISSTVGLIFQSQGRTDWMFWWGSFSGGVSMVGIIIGVWMGSLAAIATCLLCVGILLVIPSFSIAGRLIGMTVREVLRAASGVFSCAAVMAGSVWVLGTLLPSNWSHWKYLAVQVAFGVSLYVVLAHLVRLSAYQELRAVVIRQVRATVGPPVVPAAVIGD
jgi:O-antigen/teichoic acid export membrane protein